MKDYAIKCHRDTNHLYDGKPYEIHLSMVVAVAEKFIYLIPAADRANVIDACWCHDVIEDCRQTYNDVKQATNLRVAELVYAVTNEKGRSRKDRANEKYYEGIRNVPAATFIKLCDRIANVEYSKQTNSRMFIVYANQFDEFSNQLQLSSKYTPMVDYLYSLCCQNEYK